MSRSMEHSMEIVNNGEAFWAGAPDLSQTAAGAIEVRALWVEAHLCLRFISILLIGVALGVMILA